MYFYLEWNDKRPSCVKLLMERPNKINFENKFKIKSVEYIICGYINPDFKDYEINKIKYSKTNYLLSHLQKAVRKMDDIKSIKTAKHLIDLDYNSFIRRLPIIMLEDVNIHSSISVLIWLMIANTKGFQKKDQIIKWLLGIVYHLAKSPEKTNYSNKEIKEIKIDEEDIILQCLRFRKAYGGMKGDLNMIEYYIHLLKDNKINVNNDKIKIIKLEVGDLRKKDWIIEANDFHCNRYIISYVHKKYPSYQKEYIKKLIWLFSSSYNSREKIEKDKDLEKDWNVISDFVKNYQSNCIYY